MPWIGLRWESSENETMHYCKVSGRDYMERTGRGNNHGWESMEKGDMESGAMGLY